MFEIQQALEIVRREDLALNDGKVNFDLVHPTGMNGCVNQDGVGPALLESSNGSLAAMRGTIVDDPENASGRSIRFLGHDLVHQSVERNDTGGGFTAAEDPGTMDVPSREVGPGPAALVFGFHAHGLIRLRGPGRMLASAGLDTGLLIGRQDVIVRAQWRGVPAARIEVEHAFGFGGEMRISWKDPTAVVPGPDRILAQPAPQGRAADLGYQALAENFPSDLRDSPSGEGPAVIVG